MPSALAIKEKKIPFSTKPDHEHVWVKTGEWRKYDRMICKVVAKGNVVKLKAGIKAQPCNVQRWTLRRKAKLNKKTGIIAIRPLIFTPVRLTNGFADMQFKATK